MLHKEFWCFSAIRFGAHLFMPSKLISIRKIYPKPIVILKSRFFRIRRHQNITDIFLLSIFTEDCMCRSQVLIAALMLYQAQDAILENIPFLRKTTKKQGFTYDNRFVGDLFSWIAMLLVINTPFSWETTVLQSMPSSTRTLNGRHCNSVYIPSLIINYTELQSCS